MNKYYLLVLSLIFIFMDPPCIKGQKVSLYTTTQGHIRVAGKYKGQTLSAKSRELEARLDYETAKVELSLDLSGLETGNDSLNQVLDGLDEEKISMTGELGMKNIETKPHPLKEFKFSGELIYKNKVKLISGTGNLEHLSETGLVACMLGLTFDIPDPQIEELFGKEFEDLSIHMIQSVLKRKAD